MEFYQLKSFVAVAEAGNLTRAAERLFTSQPAVSAHIKALEEELGLALFDRTARGMALTRDGEALLEKARATLASVRSLNEMARSLQTHPSGPLRIGVMLDGDDLRLDAISALLNQAQPNLQLQLLHSNSGAIVKGVLDGDLDLGFAEEIPDTPLLHKLHVGQTRVAIIASPAFREAFAAPDWKSLEALPWVFKTPDCSYHQLMSRIALAHGLSLNRQYVIDHEATCLQFARKGIAISIANANTVRPEFERGDLIAWPHFQGALDVQLVCLAKRAQDRPVQAFLAATQAALANDHS